jgi:drug/metabolite transporter (DMT)-like permease
MFHTKKASFVLAFFIPIFNWTTPKNRLISLYIHKEIIMQKPWWKQLIIGLALFLAGYFMFGGGKIGTPNIEPAPAKTSSVLMQSSQS